VTNWLRRPAPRVWAGIDAGSTAALVVAGALIGVTHGSARVGWVAVAAAMALTQLLAQARRRVAARRAIRDARQLADDIRTSTNYAISNAFMPILRLVTELFEAADDSTRAMIRAQIATSVVYAASSAIGPDVGVRACFFVLDPTSRRLAWSGLQAGRDDEPKSEFAAGTTAGDLAVSMVVEDGYLFCADVELDPPPGWHDHPHVYRTFLAVPVRAADHAVGMLTVDSLAPGDLDPDRDTPVLRVLARILAISRIGSAADGAERSSGIQVPNRGTL
jgi:hypothetical protein